MVLRLTLEEILGVYVLDETRLPEKDLEQISHHIVSLYLYLNEKRQTCYLYHFYLLDYYRELSIYEEGFFYYQSNATLLSFEVVDKYELQVIVPEEEDPESYHKAYYHYEPPQQETMPIHTDKGFYLDCHGRFLIPVERDIYGRKSEEVVQELINTGQRYRGNWESIRTP